MYFQIFFIKKILFNSTKNQIDIYQLNLEKEVERLLSSWAS